MWNFSKRAPIFATKGCVASSQPIASEVGMQILQNGGNAADAAVGMAAALNVTQPCSTGIGGDAFCLFYDAKNHTVKGLNGSGRAPAAMTLDFVLDKLGKGAKEIPLTSALSVTVPGTCRAWEDTLKHFGTKTLAEVLEGPIALAEKGFPVAPHTAKAWQESESLLKQFSTEMLVNGTRAPQHGEIVKMPYLAQTFKEVAQGGSQSFYGGRIGASLVSCLNDLGSPITMQDLADHTSTMDTPISVNYRGYDVWEIPPNGQGITALVALNIYEALDLKNVAYHSPEHFHLMMEAMRLAFADTRYYVADPTFSKVPVQELLSKQYAKERASLIRREAANQTIQHGVPFNRSNTVYLSVVDEQGNACSFINSNYHGFGTGIIPEKTGFTLQNRGCNFSLDPSHPNVIAPKKRPYHTIIPGMITRKNEKNVDELFCSFGVMGGFMQPQGHFQVVSNLIDWKLDPQAAIDSPRFCIGDGTHNGRIFLEEGVPVDTIEKLAKMGHNVEKSPLTGWDRNWFGNGQIIQRFSETTTCAGSDSRCDGNALGKNL